MLVKFSRLFLIYIYVYLYIDVKKQEHITLDLPEYTRGEQRIHTYILYAIYICVYAYIQVIYIYMYVSSNSFI